MKELFNPDGIIMTALQMIADLLLLNLCFLLCSLPVLTIGPSVAAMYGTLFKKERSHGICTTFFQQFRQNFTQSFALWSIVLGLGFLLAVDFHLLNLLSGSYVWVRYILILAGIALVGTSCYAFPMIAHYHSPNARIFKTAFLLSIYKLPYTVLLIALAILPLIFLILSTDLFAATLIIWILVGFAACAKLSSYALLNIFAQL